MCPPRGGADPTVSSIAGQETQQNVVAEVSAQPFPALPITLIPSKCVCFPLEPWGEPPPGPCAWGGGCAVPGNGVPWGELAARRSRPHGCCSSPACSGRVAKEVMESSAKIKREPPEIHR